ncbi:hypothetical protein [Brevibacillus borstelensis]|uniref:hypothetical protein n=1 Tax=Brevibacillus borstelensis TaxID=45462 RepID=UPI0030C51CC5
MCMELFVISNQSKEKINEVISAFEASPYLSMGLLPNRVPNRVRRLFPGKQIVNICTEEGCACRFSTSKSPEKLEREREKKRRLQKLSPEEWEELKRETRELYEHSVRRMNALRQFCWALSDEGIRPVELYGLWIDDPVHKNGAIRMEWDQLFNDRTFDIKEEHYIVTSNEETVQTSEPFRERGGTGS